MNEPSSSLRFFHAASETETLRISVNDSLFTPKLAYRAVSSYGPVPSGFASVTLSGERTRRVYLQKTLDLFLPVPYTAAVIETANGPDLRLMADMPCPVSQDGFGCIRIANLALGSPPLDFYLYGSRLMFADVNFKEITPFKPLKPGEYGFYMTPGQDMDSPLLSILTDIEAGGMYTMCVLNGSWQPDALDVMVLPYGTGTEQAPEPEPAATSGNDA